MNKLERLMKNKKSKQNSWIWIIGCTLLAFFSAGFVLQPADYGPGDVIAAVNSLRAEYGLQAYDPSSSLSTICQAQAEYMASIGRLTHERADGSSVPTTAENVAYGPISWAIASWVDDQPHFDTLTAWSTAQVGAGVAEAADGSVYICLNITRYSDTVFAPIPYTRQPGETPQPTAEVILQPTQQSAPGIGENEAAEEGENSGNLTQAAVASTPLAVVMEDTGESFGEMPAQIVELLPAERQAEDESLQSGSGKTAGFLLVALGIVGAGGSMYGLFSRCKQPIHRADAADSNKDSTEDSGE